MANTEAINFRRKYAGYYLATDHPMGILKSVSGSWHLVGAGKLTVHRTLQEAIEAAPAQWESRGWDG